MNFTLVQILSYSAGIGAIIGLFRIKAIEQAYYPFVFFLCCGFLNEVISTICIRVYRSNTINSNIYVIVSSLLLIWSFYNWRLFASYKKLPTFIALLYIGAWVTDNFILGSIHHFNSYYRILYSFITVLFSIHLINRLIVEHRGRLIKNPLFLIGISFIVFFTYKALVEIFWIYGLNSTKDFRVNVYRIMTYINLCVNLIYAIAVLWIPRKQEYTKL